MEFIIDPAAYAKLYHWIDKAPGEISGLGMAQMSADGQTLFISDVFLFEQENSGASTDIGSERDGSVSIAQAQHRWMAALPKETLAAICDGKIVPGRDMPWARWWWHSHSNMRAFWSGTDTETIRQLGSAEWFAATVFNRKGEYRSAMFLGGQWRHFLDDIKLRPGDAYAEKRKEWDAEYERNVKTRTYIVGPSVPRAQGYLGAEARANGGWQDSWHKQMYGDWEDTGPVAIPVAIAERAAREDAAKKGAAAATTHTDVVSTKPASGGRTWMEEYDDMLAEQRFREAVAEEAEAQPLTEEKRRRIHEMTDAEFNAAFARGELG